MKDQSLKFNPTNMHRFIFFFIIDSVIITLSLFFAFFLRFDFRPEFYSQYNSLIYNTLPLFLFVKLSFLIVFRTYQISWTYVSIGDLYKIVKALLFSQFFLLVIIYYLIIPGSFHLSLMMFDTGGFPKSILFIDGIISIFAIGGVRIFKRLYLEILVKHTGSANTIIIGAGNTGDMIARHILRQKSSEFVVVGFLDDNKALHGVNIHGLKVMGGIDKLREVIYKYSIKTIIIAIPSMNKKDLRTIYEIAKKNDVENIKIVPMVSDFRGAKKTITAIEDIKIEDLIGRQIINRNDEDMENFLFNETILITGAAGSIGSEITTQCCTFNPKMIVLFDMDETALHSIELILKKTYPYLIDKMVFVIGDIRDKIRLREIFSLYKPDKVFHAAAYKHVPMMEVNPAEAVKANIIGTFNVTETAQEFGVKKFIMISTDKAVRPTSVMGATKRMAEKICRTFNNDHGTQFISVRFGNVLGSRGSVLPLFLNQLKEGGPLTVTHRDIKRYFMTIPEAVSLVLQASIIGNGGDIMVLDMGEPIKIVTLAEELIKIHGLEPYIDIDIKFIGLRPGEKLFEEIFTHDEKTEISKHERIIKAKQDERYTLDEIKEIIERFQSIVCSPSNTSDNKIRTLLKKYVAWYED